MSQIPIVGFVAYSGSGKTTLIEKLIIVLKENGLRTAAIKHDCHTFEIDHEGKDSWRFTNAGADITIINSDDKTAYVKRSGLEFEQLIDLIHDVDLVLVEGYKNLNIPQIGVARKATGKGLPFEPEHFIAIVTDMEIDTAVPCFGLNDIHPLAEFIIDRMESGHTLSTILV